MVKKKRATAKRKAIKRKTPRRKAARKKLIKKRVAKRTQVKRRVKKTGAAKKIGENIIGIVTHYFPHVRAAVVKLKAPLAIGDSIKVKGHTTDFKQAVTSMQIDRVPINAGQKSQEIGLLVESRVRRHDKVYKA